MWESIIGLEVHIELKTKSKMFCGCYAEYFGHPPNSHVCPVCLGLPGALPVANNKAIESVLAMGVALTCSIPLDSKFDRKNYFYPDLPKGYQISQYDMPLALGGSLGEIRIRRVHLEEDTAKMFHTGTETLIDFNRSGVPLMELVTEPDIRSAAQAKEILIKLQQIVRYLGISDCDMEKGSMRLEANISVRKAGTKELPNYKVEVKNLNSFRFVEKAIDFEIKRQIDTLEKGGKVIQETRGWNETKQKTFSQRLKEEAQDYRYFPEPDIPPLISKKSLIEKIRNKLPELPKERESRFEKEFSLTPYQAKILTADLAIADYFEEALKVGREHDLLATEIANVIINKKVDLDKLLPAELVKILSQKRQKVYLPDKDLKKAVLQVITENQSAVREYKKGKLGAIEYLVGQVMRLTKGQAEPNSIRTLLREVL